MSQFTHLLSPTLSESQLKYSDLYLVSQFVSSCTGFDRQCESDGTKDANTIDAARAVYCGGYQACAWGPKITALMIFCGGEEACAGNTVIDAGSNVKCQGQRACSLVTFTVFRHLFSRKCHILTKSRDFHKSDTLTPSSASTL